MQEQETQAYTAISPDRLPSELDTDITEEFIKEGFNHFVDNNMLLYTTVMEKSSELDLTYEEPGTFKKLRDGWFSSKVPVKSGYARIHEFIVSMTEVANVSQEDAAIHMVRHGVMELDGKGCGSEQEYKNVQYDAADFDNDLKDRLDVEAEMTEVDPVAEEEIEEGGGI